jgi:general secretion pathway protein A
MFFTHFNLSDHPFCENPPMESLLCDERFDRALARLKFFEQTGSLALIIGQTGAGKSTLLRFFKQNLPKNRRRPLYLHLTQISSNALLRMIVTRLGEAPRMGKDRLFLQLVDRVRKNEGETLLIIDEAHLLPSQALTDLRLLISSGLDPDLPLKIVLCGQEPLALLLKRSAHADLVGRICIRIRLDALSTAQTTAYIDHRIRAAGGSQKLFTAEAKQLIHDYSGGVCRHINNIATACLIHACDKNMQLVDETIVIESLNEFHPA